MIDNLNEIQFLIYEDNSHVEVIVQDETLWATDILKEYIQKGFKIDVERMKQGESIFGKDYFRELLETVRSIRASERRIWQQITDIFAEISYDYDKNSEITREFYATVQNKFHYAITGKTAAEIVYESADQDKDYMGLTSWKNSSDGRILQSDVVIAKNYLLEKEIPASVCKNNSVPFNSHHLSIQAFTATILNPLPRTEGVVPTLYIPPLPS